ncbi:monocyte to macrophage differentiation factor [Arctopsyche grandis]|uniref:monocyte to macrophage differentiation factor n=1 Tax=Arctopsyche grandis TaxID=121162 RepID=UPI00406D6D7E
MGLRPPAAHSSASTATPNPNPTPTPTDGAPETKPLTGNGSGVGVGLGVGLGVGVGGGSKSRFRGWMNRQAPLDQQYQPTEIEHIANVVTHGVCMMPSMIATYELIRRSANMSQYVAASVYGTALSMLFAISTTFHSVFYCKSDCNMRHVLHRCDRAMIYVFIAGSYFPWLTISTPNSGLLKEMQWIIWLLATLGIAYQQMFHERYKKLETIFYLITGIGPVIAITISGSRLAGIEELKLGGLLYFIGIFFFKSDGRIPMAHAIWHIFVAFGATVHYMAILNYLYPASDSTATNNIQDIKIGNDEF